MTETPTPGHAAEAPTPTKPTDPDPIGRRAQFLTMEHWSLLATRSMSWNERRGRRRRRPDAPRVTPV